MDGRHHPGLGAERVFGKKNFLELYAVFSSPVLYRVQTAGGRDLGSLEQDFVDRLVEEMSSFLLAGRAWMVERVNNPDRTVLVREAPRGRNPSWGGFIPQMLGFELCQRMKRILIEDKAYPYLDPRSATALSERRENPGELLRRGGLALQLDEGVARWWTFAGGRINHTLKYGLEWRRGWKVVADNFQLRIEGNGLTHEMVAEVIQEMTREGFWHADATRQALRARLPEYRLSKFQDAMPETMELELIGSWLLDFDGTRSFLST